MTSPFAQFTTDAALEQGGVWLNFGGYQIKVARAGGANKRFAQVSEQHFKDHKRAAETGVLPEEVALRQLILVFADAVILGWRTLDGYNTDDTPKWRETLDGPEGPMAFTRENIIKLLNALPDLFNEIRAHANNFQNFRAQQRSDNAGN